MNLKKKILLIISLIALAVLTYSPHFLYPLPYHLDEWDHIGRSIRLQEQGFSYFNNHSPIEIGFDIILLIISIILSLFKIDIVFVYQFLPAINSLAIALILFFYMKKQINNYWLALSALPFLAFLPSNVNILGMWFYAPILAAIPFIYLSLFNLEKAVEEKSKKNLYLTAFFLFILAFIHQSSFLLLFIISTVYLSFNYKFVIENKKIFYPLTILIIPAIIMFLHLTNNLSNISNFFSSFVWGPISPQINYNPFTFYGIISSLFALIGFYISFKNKLFLQFRIYFLISLISILIFPLTQFTIFSAYQRYIYHFMIASIPLSALGFYISIKWINNKLDKINNKLRLFILIAIILLIFLGMFYNYFTLHPKTKLYHAIEPSEIPVLQSLSGYPPGIVLTPIDMGIAVRPITKVHDPALTFFDWKKTEDLEKFYNSDCENIKESLYNNYLTEKKISYILSRKTIECDNLKLLENEYPYKLYQFERNNLVLLYLKNIKASESIPTITKKELIVNNFTIITQIKLEQINLAKIGIIKSVYGDGYRSGWSVGIENSRIVFKSGNLTNKKAVYSSEILKANNNYDIKITYQDKNLNIYINNKLDKSTNVPLSYDYNSSAPILVNGYWDTGKTDNIQEILILNKSLSMSEIEHFTDI